MNIARSLQLVKETRSPVITSLTRGVGVATSNRVCSDKRHHLSVIEAHAPKDVTDVLNSSSNGTLVRIREAPCSFYEHRVRWLH